MLSASAGRSGPSWLFSFFGGSLGNCLCDDDGRKIVIRSRSTFSRDKECVRVQSCPLLPLMGREGFFLFKDFPRLIFFFNNGQSHPAEKVLGCNGRVIVSSVLYAFFYLFVSSVHYRLVCLLPSLLYCACSGFFRFKFNLLVCVCVVLSFSSSSSPHLFRIHLIK